MSDVELTAMRWWHLQRLADLDAQLFGPDVWSVETFWSELAAADRYFVVARQAGTPDGRSGPDAEPILGYAGIALGGRAGTGAPADVQTVAVAPYARRRGIGRLLIEHLIETAARRGAGSLMLEVRADNPSATALYDAVGFERIAVRRGYYAPGLDAWVMRLRPLPGVAGVGP